MESLINFPRSPLLRDYCCCSCSSSRLVRNLTADISHLLKHGIKVMRE